MNSDRRRARVRSRSRDHDPENPENRQRVAFAQYRFLITAAVTVPESSTVTEALLAAVGNMIHAILFRAARLLQLDRILCDHRGPDDAFEEVRLIFEEDDGSMAFQNDGF